nr:sigma factor [Angustibacter aerolatus]
MRAHLPIVGYLVSEIISRVPQQVQRDDLVSAGQAALVKSARTYDATTGVPFGHYARTRIRGALVDELRAADWASRGARTRAKQPGQRRGAPRRRARPLAHRRRAWPASSRATRPP